MGRIIQPPWPQPARGLGLWSRCIFAHAVGAIPGADPAPSLLSASREDIQQRPYKIDSSLDTGSWQTKSNIGRDLRQVPSLDEFTYGNVQNRYHPRFGRVSIACLVRMQTISLTGTAQGILDKATAPQSTTNTEYTIGTNGTASTYRMYVTPTAGASNLVNSTTTLSLGRTDMLIGTYVSETSMRLYVNGVMEADIVPGNSGIKDISGLDLGWFLMKGGTGVTITDAAVGMGAVWERELTRSEIMTLSADPYVMWKHRPQVYGLPEAAPPAPGDADNSCCPCCGGLVHGPYGRGVLPGMVPIGM